MVLTIYDLLLPFFSSPDALYEWAYNFFNSRTDKIDLTANKCCHNRRPWFPENNRCFHVGTVDSIKEKIVFKRATVIKHIKEWLEDHADLTGDIDHVPMGSSHLDGCHMSFLANMHTLNSLRNGRGEAAVDAQTKFDLGQRFIMTATGTRAVDSMQLRHLCGCSTCNNPKHLLPGSVSENDLDKHYHHHLRLITDQNDYATYKRIFPHDTL